MKKLTRILFIVACLCLPIALQAQKKDDSRYLTGAVPEENGKVVFSKTFSIPGMSQDAVFDRILQWMDARLKKNENNSRVVYTKRRRTDCRARRRMDCLQVERPITGPHQNNIYTHSLVPARRMYPSYRKNPVRVP